MTKEIKRLVLSAVVLIAMVGLSSAWNYIKVFASAFYSLFVTLIPFLDLEQAILCKVVTILFVQVLCGAGFVISHRTELKIGKIVSGIADVIATLLLFIA